MTNASSSTGRYSQGGNKDRLRQEYYALELQDVDETVTPSWRDEEEPGNPASLLAPSSSFVEMDGVPPATSNGNFCGICTYSRMTNAAARCLLGVISLFLGLITLWPNLMRCDSGTKVAAIFSLMGAASSFLFVFAGIAICVRGAWIWMLVAFACEVLSFVVPAFLLFVVPALLPKSG
jgi:hypothetical protein